MNIHHIRQERGAEGCSAPAFCGDGKGALLLFAGADGIIALYLPLCGGGRRGGAPRRGPAGRESRAAQGGNRVC